MLIIGAQMLVLGATETACSLGVSEAMIGLSLVAIGTSLPESASIGIAAWRGQTDMALGNIIGSKIFNTFAILETTSTVVPIAIDPYFQGFDIWMMLPSTALLLPLMLTGAQISRLEGSLFLAGYAAYIERLYYGL